MEVCGPSARRVQAGGAARELLGEMARPEGLRQHLRQGEDSRRGLQEEVRSPELVQQLTAAAARDEDLAPAVDAREMRQPAPAGPLQLRDQPALGAQAEAVGGVLDI